MNNNLKFRILTIVAVILVCVYFIIGLPKSKAEILENWNNNIHLGLDLRGGSQLVLRVNLQDAFKATADAVIDKMKDAMRAAMIEYTDIDRNDPQTLEEADSIQINVTGVPAVKAAAFRQLFQDNFNDVWILTPVGQTDYHLTMQPSKATGIKGCYAHIQHQHHRQEGEQPGTDGDQRAEARPQQRRRRDHGAVARRGRSRRTSSRFCRSRRSWSCMKSWAVPTARRIKHARIRVAFCP